MKILKWLRQIFHSHTAHEIISTERVMYGVYDVTFKCTCGISWTSIYRPSYSGSCEFFERMIFNRVKFPQHIKHPDEGEGIG